MSRESGEGRFGPQARRRSRRSGPEVRLPAGAAGGLRLDWPLAGTLRGRTAEAWTSDISDLQEFERAR